VHNASIGPGNPQKRWTVAMPWSGQVDAHRLLSEAVGVLERANEKFEFPVNWGVDLQSEHERYLTEKYAKKPGVVINYPKDIKAFCMRVNDDGRTVAAMDVLALGIGEIIGGSRSQPCLCRTAASGKVARNALPGPGQ
jgi:hypothetical protein